MIAALGHILYLTPAIAQPPLVPYRASMLTSGELEKRVDHRVRAEQVSALLPWDPQVSKSSPALGFVSNMAMGHSILGCWAMPTSRKKQSTDGGDTLSPRGQEQGQVVSGEKSQEANATQVEAGHPSYTSHSQGGAWWAEVTRVE